MSGASRSSRSRSPSQGGRINANQFSRFARRLESEYETVDLNRTQIGFSHGDDVFGWRFYPRFQAPPVSGNISTLVRDNILGGPSRNRLLRGERLEPGPRECVALVVMPSFVPNFTLEVATNWFGLANPKHKAFDHTQAMHLSRKVQAIRANNCTVTDAGRYRAGDLGRLVNRAEQLSARLPLQTLGGQVPTDGNLGGFELFVNGTSDLAPELYGWYGAPGIDRGKDTTLFLVGDHFSVTQSRVLVGNQEVTNKKLISRQVMQVTVPQSAIPTARGEIQVNVATPYGVSQDLLVPVANLPKPPVAVAALPNAAAVTYEKQGTNAGDGKFRLDGVRGQVRRGGPGSPGRPTRDRPRQASGSRRRSPTTAAR